MELIWRRDLFEWEKLQVCQLLEVVEGLSPISTFGDRWIWQGGESLEFSVNSSYGLLRGEIEGGKLTYVQFFFGRLRLYPRPTL